MTEEPATPGISPFWAPRYGRPDIERDPEGYMRWLLQDFAANTGELQPLRFPIIEEAYTIGPAKSTEKRWYVVVVEPSKENSVARDLTKDGIETVVIERKFYAKRAARKGKRTVLSRPVVPGYVFAGLAEPAGGISRIMATRGARDVLPHADAPLCVPAEEITRLRRMEEAGEFDSTTRGRKGWGKAKPTGPLAWIQPKAKILVEDGPFANMPAIIEAVDAGRRRVKAEVMIFGRASPIELEFSQFRSA